MTRVLLLGEVRVHREGLAALISGDGRIEVTEHLSIRESHTHASAADVIVVDVVGAGLDVIREVIANADAPIVALGAPDDEEQVIALAELGVLGFVECEAELDALIAAVDGAARGEAAFPARIATTLLRRVSLVGTRRRSSDRASALTMREWQVAGLIAEGLSNKEIAAELCIEVATVKNHVHNILEKLGVRRRFDAVARLRLVERERPEPTFADAGSTTGFRAG